MVSSSASSAAAEGLSLSSLLSYATAHIIPLFFAWLGLAAVGWIVGFNYLFPKALILRVFMSLGVNNVRTKRAFAELKRKSFHLAGLLIPAIYWLGLHYSGGFITKPFGLKLLGAVTAFLWIVELLRFISPSFRGHYNRLFSTIMRKQELQADAATALVPTEEGSFANAVDQIVQSITTPLLGELPASPRQNNASSELHQRNPPSVIAHGKPAAAPSAADLEKQRTPDLENVKYFTGTGFFFLGNFLAMLFFDPTVATCSMLFLILGDLTAAIVGISFGSIKIPGTKKSLEGSVAMFVVCFLIGSVFYFHTPGSTFVVILAALSATLIELLGPERWWADDNITIPLFAGAAFTIGQQLTGISSS